MRIIVVLKSTNKRGTKMAYTTFRKTLLADGFVLVAPEIFMRITTNRKSAKLHIEKLAGQASDTGTIRVLALTELQFHNIIYLTGEEDYQEKMIGGNCHVSL